MPRVLVGPYLLETASAGDEFELERDAGRKLVRVLRLGAGETFRAFDGRGREWECVLAETDDAPGRRQAGPARAVVLRELEQTVPGALQLSIAQAVPKGDKMEWVVQKGTELGVREFWPFESQRTVARLDAEDLGHRAALRGERWRRIAAEAARQCGRVDVPVVHAVAEFSTVVGSGTNGGRCLMLDEAVAAEPLRVALEREPLRQGGKEERVMLLVGPEGGWTAEERTTAQRCGAEAVNLGPRVLRTETAALVATAVLQWMAGGLE